MAQNLIVTLLWLLLELRVVVNPVNQLSSACSQHLPERGVTEQSGNAIGKCLRFRLCEDRRSLVENQTAPDGFRFD